MAWTERYISPSGAGAHDGTSEANAWTLAEAIAAPYAAGQRLNVKAGTYSETTNTRTLSVTGTTTAPVWVRGYSTTIGDLDNDFTTTKPLISHTTGRLVVSGAHHILSNLNINGAFTTGEQLSISGVGTILDRVRVENTNAAAASSAIKFLTNNGQRMSRSWAKATSSATRVIESAVQAILTHCVILGGGAGFEQNSAVAVSIAGCLVLSAGSHGIYINAGGIPVNIRGNTVYRAGGDGIRLTAAPSTCILEDNLLVSNAGYGINNSSGANTNFIHRVANGFFGNTSGEENGFGDSPHFSKVAEASSPFVNAAGGDLALLLSALSVNAGMGLFENTALTSYLDIGALQHKDQGVITVHSPQIRSAYPFAAL